MEPTIDEGRVNGVGGNGVGERGKLDPFFILLLHSNLHDERFAFVGVEESPPFFQREPDLAVAGRDFELLSAWALNGGSAGAAWFENGEVQGRDVAGKFHPGIIGINSRRTCDVVGLG